ncbi:MAG: M13 family peptidase, partial [Allosphingosinicella sp.]
MIKKIALCGAAVAALAAGAFPALSAQTRAAHPAAAGHAAPMFGTFGFDATGMDRSVNPGDNFYDFANGNWARTTQIPADKAAWGLSSALGELSTKRTRDIIETAARSNAPAGSVERKVGDFYGSFMDEAAIEAKGLAPLQPYLAQVAAIASKSDLARAFATLAQYGVGSPFELGVQQDLKEN